MSSEFSPGALVAIFVSRTDCVTVFWLLLLSWSNTSSSFQQKLFFWDIEEDEFLSWYYAISSLIIKTYMSRWKKRQSLTVVIHMARNYKYSFSKTPFCTEILFLKLSNNLSSYWSFLIVVVAAAVNVYSNIYDPINIIKVILSQ